MGSGTPAACASTSSVGTSMNTSAYSRTMNYVAFLHASAEDLMKAGGKMCDAGYPIGWGPGRHGPRQRFPLRRRSLRSGDRAHGRDAARRSQTGRRPPVCPEGCRRRQCRECPHLRRSSPGGAAGSRRATRCGRTGPAPPALRGSRSAGRCSVGQIAVPMAREPSKKASRGITLPSGFVRMRWSASACSRPAVKSKSLMTTGPSGRGSSGT